MRRMYSENQVLKLLENRDVKAKTFWQEEYNWISATPTLNSQYLNGLSVVASYMKAVQINRRIDIIISVLLQNGTESTITTVGSKSLITEITFPSELSKLIYRKDGSTCNNTKDSWDGILSTNCVFTRVLTGVGEQKACLFSSPTANHFTIFMPSGSTYSLSAGEKCAVDVRISLLL